jgi:hypothetical protein
MFLRRKGTPYSSVERAAMALAAAGGVAHGAFFMLFALRVIGRDGIGTLGWLILAALAGLGLALNFVGYFLVKRGDRVPRRWGYLAIAASTGLAGVLLGIASWVD